MLFETFLDIGTDLTGKVSERSWGNYLKPRLRSISSESRTDPKGDH